MVLGRRGRRGLPGRRGCWQRNSIFTAQLQPESHCLKPVSFLNGEVADNITCCCVAIYVDHMPVPGMPAHRLEYQLLLAMGAGDVAQLWCPQHRRVAANWIVRLEQPLQQSSSPPVGVTQGATR